MTIPGFHSRLSSLVNQYADGNKAEFCRNTGITQHALGHCLNRGHLPKIDMIFRILKAYPEVDARWLITGKKK